MKKVLSSQEIAEKYILGVGMDALTDNQEMKDLIYDIDSLVLKELRKNGLLGYPMAEQETKEPIIKECEHPYFYVTQKEMCSDLDYCTKCKTYLNQ